jgi:hypothetical protein
LTSICSRRYANAYATSPCRRGSPSGLIERLQGHNEPIYLAGILRAWGPAAAGAQAELAKLLPHHPIQAADALAALAHLSPESLERLREAAGSGTIADRLAVGRALQILTGETTALREAVIVGLGRQRAELAAAAIAAMELPGPDTELGAILDRALRASTAAGRSKPDVEARLHTAHAHWQHTGDTDLVLAAVRSTLDWAAEHDHSQWTAAAAADVAAHLAADAQNLLPDLERLLSHPTTCPAAAHALLSIDPQRWGGESRHELAAYLTEAIEKGTSFPAQHRAVDVPARLSTPLPPPIQARLHALAERERRILSAGLEKASVRSDENLRRAIQRLKSAPHTRGNSE